MDLSGQEQKGIKLVKGKAFDYIKDRKKAMELIKVATQKTKSEQGRFESFKNQMLLLLDVLQDWHSGDYRQIPYKSITMVVIGILYFVIPTDLIPDIFLGVGLIDDATMLAYIFKQIGKDLGRYKDWKSNRNTMLSRNETD
jgi:uncharacterized membrane protein YkvA (DUF1232 family)